MNEFIDIESMLDGSKIVWHGPIEFDMTEGSPPTTVIPLDRFDTHIVLHPVIEFDISQPEPRADGSKPKDNGPLPEQDKKSA